MSLIYAATVFEFANRNRQLAASAKQIAATDIYLRLCAVLGVSHIETSAPPSDYIKGEDPVKALRAFAAVLNQSKQFKPDGLDLSPGDLGGAKKMKRVGGAIVDWYEGAGWKVI